MPSRKSDTSVARFVLADDDHEDSTMTTEPTAAPEPSATDEPSVAGSTQPPADKKDKEKERDNLTIEDLALPKSIITRLAKGVLPPNTQIQANAILALTKSATVFINHLANAANDITVSSNKKTIMPGDVFKALDEIEYGFMREKLEAEFAKFNEVQTSKRSTYRRKVAAAKKAATGTGTGDGEGAAGASQNSGTDAGAAADLSMMSLGFTTMGGDETERSMLLMQQQRSPSSGPGVGGGAGAGAEQPRLAKKARLDPSSMEVDDDHEVGDDGEGGEGEVSDAETVPEEQEEEEEEEEDDEVEEEEEDEEEEDGEEEGAGEDGDELEERAAREEEDEALDDDSD